MQGASGPRWDDVRVFLAAHRHRSLGAAAARLGLDTSTVSRRISALEASLEMRLFERTRDGLVPTRAAEQMLSAAETMEAAYGKLTRDASEVEAEAEGVVRLSVAPGMADVFVAPALVRLRQRHPKIEIELDASVRALDLTRGEADLALRSTKPHGADLIITKLASAHWIAATSPTLAAELEPLASWDGAPWITWDRDLASLEPSRWLARYVPKARIVLRTSHMGSQLVAAETGLGVALLPEPYVHIRRLHPLRYKATLAGAAKAWPTDHLWLVGHRALRDVPRIAAVWRFLAEEFRAGLSSKARSKRT